MWLIGRDFDYNTKLSFIHSFMTVKVKIPKKIEIWLSVHFGFTVHLGLLEYKIYSAKSIRYRYICCLY
ncbi:hypothetical protein WN944_003698 [Citrus x changshan-huyou]|uniref:Uncharacterized protein n=1 Tax=Citrus x changshan-huyou TaxID=2935761 RepID=A0AAP0QFN8_9ROSI